MPGYDRTGPMGRGPLSGGGFGRCGGGRWAGAGRDGCGYGRASMAGCGWGPGRGYRRRRFRAMESGGDEGPRADRALELRDYARDLEAELSEVRQRMTALAEAKKSEEDA